MHQTFRRINQNKSQSVLKTPQDKKKIKSYVRILCKQMHRLLCDVHISLMHTVKINDFGCCGRPTSTLKNKNIFGEDIEGVDCD